MGTEQQRPQLRRPAPESAVSAHATEQKPVEGSREAAVAAISEMRATARRFDELLVQYGALLQESASVERTLDQNMRTLEAAKAVEKAKARAAELGMALLKNATSAALIGGSAGLASASMGADPLSTAIAAASGALAGVVAEQSMQYLERHSDASEHYYSKHSRTAAFMEQKKKQANVSIENHTAATAHLELQRQIAEISAEIDGLQNVYPALDPGVPKNDSDSQSSYEDIRQKIETLKNFGAQLDALLIQYHLAAQLNDSISDDVERAQQQVRYRETQIAAGVAVRQVIETTSHLLRQGVVATIFGMGVYVYNGIYQVGLQSAPLISSAALAGVSLHYFFDRFEKKVGQGNVPSGIYEHAAAVEGDVEYQKFSDIQLRERREFLEDLQHFRDEMKGLEENLSNNIDALLQS